MVSTSQRVKVAGNVLYVPGFPSPVPHPARIVAMKNLKAFFALPGLIAIISVPALIGQSTPPPPPNSFPTPPRDVEALWKSNTGTRIVTFPILPGQALKVYNPYFDYVKIETTFPVAVHMGNCNSERTIEFECRDLPPDSYILVYDSRVGTSPDYSPRNPIKFIAVHHRPID
jgi:hypothetical protein